MEKITGPKTDYRITEAGADPATVKYLGKIRDERVRENTKNLSDDPGVLSRQEDYLEQVLRADLLKALHARGFYDAKIAFNAGGEPFAGEYRIDYGPKFTIADIELAPRNYAQSLANRYVRPGAPLDAAQVLREQDLTYRNIAKDQCYFSLSVENEVRLDRARNDADVRFVVDAGEQAKFGPLSFKGNEKVDEAYLRRLLPWKEGDCYRTEKMESYKTALLKSGLFARAETVLPDAPRADGSVPVTVALKERARRTISAGLTYYSDEGPGAIFGWEHRNLFGAAESLAVDLAVSSLNQSIEGEFTKPYFLRNDQSLSLTSALRRQDTDAFEEFGFDSGAAIKRDFTDHLSGSTGVALTISQIDDKIDETTKTYGLVSAPQTISWDTRDDALDPHRGWNLSASGAPFFDVLGESSPFFKTQFSGSGYLSLLPAADIVLASRAGIGSLWGASIEDIPATERFYAGGGGSVRGYGFQEVGPQRDGDPTGGLSLASLSIELRAKFTESLGGVAFVDAASVTEDSAPDFSKPAIGAGVGIRYYTSFGPIRFDIATPLTEKDDLDQNYQFYISIGQAF